MQQYLAETCSPKDAKYGPIGFVSPASGLGRNIGGVWAEIGWLQLPHVGWFEREVVCYVSSMWRGAVEFRFQLYDNNHRKRRVEGITIVVTRAVLHHLIGYCWYRALRYSQS